MIAADAITATARWQRWYPLLIIVAGFAVFANTFHSPFFFDDQRYILENPAIRDFRYFTDQALAENAITQGRLEPNFRTRWLTVLTFALNYRVHGLDLPGYHVINLLLHLSSALLVYALLLSLFATPVFVRWPPAGQRDSKKYIFSLFAGLLFAVHPLQTQAVTYISQRFTSQATMLYLLALVLYARWRMGDATARRDQFSPADKNRRNRFLLYWGAVAVTILAMFSKEIAFTLPVMMLLFEWMFHGRPSLWRFCSLIPFFAAMLIIPAIIFAEGTKYEDVSRLTGSLSTGGNQNLALSYLLTQFRVIVTYIRLFLLPINQNVDYDYPRSWSLLEPPVFTSLTLLALLAGLAFFLHRRSRQPGNTHAPWQRMASFGILWFFVALSVESSIIPLDDLIFEHRAYLPSVGLILAFLGGAGMVTEKSGNWGRAMPLFAVSLLGLLSVTAYSRNALWRDPIALWEDNIRKSPGKGRVHMNLAGNYKDAGRNEEAIDHANTALRLYSSTDDKLLSYALLEKLYQQRNDLQQVQQLYSVQVEQIQKTITSGLGNAQLYNDFGVLLTKMNRFQQAEAALRKAIELEGNVALGHLNLGNLYSKMNRSDDALHYLRIAARLDPDDVRTQSDLGSELLARGRSNEGLQALLKALVLDPDSPDLSFTIAYHYCSIGKTAEADRLLRKTLRRHKRDPKFLHDLGEYYERTERVSDAEEAYRSALRVNEGNAVIHAKMGALYLKTGNTSIAIESLKRAAELDPKNPDIQYNLGIAYSEVNKYQEAITAYQRVLELSPHDIGAKESLDSILKLINNAAAHRPGKGRDDSA